MTTLPARAEALLGQPLRVVARLHGGDLSEVWRLTLADGGSVIAKIGPRVAAEARMLRTMEHTGAPVPTVLAQDADLLILQDLGADDGISGAWADLGRVLRTLHAATGPGYGWPEDYAFGDVPVTNAATTDWPVFWAERRVLPGLTACPAPLARRIERLVTTLPERLPEFPRPALLHGDLWVGNVMARGGRVTGLIDPACSYGHTEVDLAMLALFGRPEPGFRQGYGPPEPGAADRQPLYQLWPALVHLRLFGAGYLGLVEGLVVRALGPAR